MKHPELLGEFLRKKRNTIAPETLGLLKPKRSRTPGLRREDIAERANISTVWYAKLERGKAEKVSRQVMLSICEALCCDQSEQQYLMNLAGLAHEHEEIGLCYNLPETSRRFIQHLNPLPATFINDYRDIIFANDAFNRMLGFDINEVPQESRNSILLASESALWRRWLNVETDADMTDCMQRTAASMRATMINKMNSAWEHSLSHILDLSTIFKKAWEQQNVKEIEEIERGYYHSEFGQITLRKQHWHNKAGEAFGYLMVFVPIDEATDRLLNSHQ